MLAEIFIVRLEAGPRTFQEKIPSSSSQLVPFRPDSRFSFKNEVSGSAGELSAVEGGKDPAKPI